MSESPVQSYEHFADHINSETDRARQQAEAMIANVSITDVRCFDGLTSKGNWNPPGGGDFLLNEGLLERFISVRAAAGVVDGIFGDHDYCGYKRVIMGLKSLNKHRRVLKRLQTEVTRLNRQYHTRFRVMTESNGSAKPYMK